MRAVLYRIRSVVRRQFAAMLVVTLIVAVVCGIVIAFAAGASRTSTAADRYTSDFGGAPDGLVIQDDRGAPRDRDVAALPGVESVESLTFVFGGLSDAKGTPLDFVYILAGSFRAGGVALVDGREADPGNAHEFVATRSFVELTHSTLGDSFNLFTLTKDQARENGFAVSDPQGPRLSIVLVGIVDGAAQLDDPTPVVVPSRALLDLPDLGVSQSIMSVELSPGATLETLRAEMDLDPRTSDLRLEPGQLISPAVRSAIQAQARGLWILAAVAAVAAVAALAQMMMRQVRPAQDERERLSAIGFTRSQILADAVGRALIPITIGSLLGAVLAVLASGRFPYGFVRAVEPRPGIRVEWVIVLGGAAVFIVALTLWTFAVLLLSARISRSGRPSSFVEAVATRTASVTAGVGIRLAFTRRSSERGSVRGSIAGVVLGVAGVVAAVTFGVSLDRLLHEPFRYGTNYDAAVGDTGAETLPAGLVDTLDADPDVTSLTLLAGSEARVGQRTIPLLGLNAVRGAAQPAILEGRLPGSDDEIAFGRLTAADVGAHVGDNVELAGTTAARVFRVTGLVVVPGLGANDGLGSGGIVTMGGLASIDPDAPVTNAVVNLRISRQEFFTSHPEFGDLPEEILFTPPEIVNVSRIRAIPFILAAVLAALALLTIGHVMLTSVRSRQRDLAILRSLGAHRGWIARAVHWQATSLTALPVIIGLPLGLVIGRLVFTAFADSMGAVNDAAIPLVNIAVGALSLLVLANGIAAIVSYRNRRRRPALLLQGE